MENFMVIVTLGFNLSALRLVLEHQTVLNYRGRIRLSISESGELIR
jgi:hypothetical protein